MATDNYTIIKTENGIGKRMSFLEMIKEYSIVIPVIQRDYAQGRLSERVTELRNDFITDLISFIKDNKSHDLDSIYGSTQDGQFVPLDGQQRLTTLFLLHLYIAGMHNDESFSKLSESLKGRFSYKTRHSSTMFCDKMIENNVFQEYKETSDKRLSDVITNQGWFYDVWNQDPTVAGMLVMLDSIDEKFRNCNQVTTDEAYYRLFEDKKYPQPITFLMLPLDGYSRKDDLYIKMNARGVHLTDFENFKAKFEDFVNRVEPDRKDVLKSKFDVEWAESLWKHRDKKDNTDLIMERIIRYVIGCCFLYNKNEGETTNTMEYLLEQNKKTMRFTFSRYCELGVFHKQGCEIDDKKAESERNIIEMLISVLDILCLDSYSPLTRECLYGWSDIAETAKELFLYGGSPQYSPRLRLYAYLKYVCQNRGNIDEADLKQWMRVVRNLDEATLINGAYEFFRSCRSIDTLLAQISSSKVLEWLSIQRKTPKGLFFRSYQFHEEVLKAKLLLWNNGDDALRNNMEQLICAAESNYYMLGQLSFLLLFAGLWKYDGAVDIKSLTAEDYAGFYESLKKYSDNAIALFDTFKKDGDNPIVDEYLLERALLAKGFYLKTASAGRWNFCNNIFERDFSWKSMLVYNPEERSTNRLQLLWFGQVLAEVDSSDVETSLRKIILSANDDNTFVSVIRDNYKLINYCSKGFIYLDGEYITGANPKYPNVILFGQSQMNHYHSELYTRDLYESQLEKYKFLHYKDVKKWDDDSGVYVKFKENGQVYRFFIYHWNYVWGYKVLHDDSLDVSAIPDEVKDKFAVIGNGKNGVEILNEAIAIAGSDICC